MRLTNYFFRQFVPPFVFGSVLFLFVLLLDRLFDLVDLIFNKGVQAFTVWKLFTLFIPTVIPLTLPMGILLSCLVTFGRISEENELTAVRAAGINVITVLWLPVFFSFALSILMVPFNTTIAPWSNRAFRDLYEQIIHAEPLINIEPHKFFSIKNIKIYADRVDKKNDRMNDVFIYQKTDETRPAERIYAKQGHLETSPDSFTMRLTDGQIQRYDALSPRQLVHTTFGTYQIQVPLNMDNSYKNTRFRNISTQELKKLISDLKRKGFSTAALEAENALRYAIAFAPLCLALVGIPMATVLKRGGKSFSFGITIIVIFTYYLFLIMGLTLAEKSVLPANVALWVGNTICLLVGGVALYRLQRI